MRMKVMIIINSPTLLSFVTALKYFPPASSFIYTTITRIASITMSKWVSAFTMNMSIILNGFMNMIIYFITITITTRIVLAITCEYRVTRMRERRS
jgi:hypothetical protein